MATIARERGQIDGLAIGAVALVVALFVAGIVAAFVLPIGINEIEGDASSTFTQDVGEEVEVTAGLNGTLEAVDDAATPSTINVTVTDTESGSSQTVTELDEGSNQTVTLSEEEITITNENVTDSDTAEVTYEYPPDYGWGGAASAMWNILGAIIVLAAFLFFVAIAIGATGRI